MEGRLTSGIFRCCHTETEPGDHGFCLSQSHNTNLFPTSREWGSISSAPYHLRYPEPAIIFLVDKLSSYTTRSVTVSQATQILSYPVSELLGNVKQKTVSWYKRRLHPTTFESSEQENCTRVKGLCSVIC